MDILLHTANVLYLLSFTMRDVLWLRVTAVAASVLLVSFFWTCDEPLLQVIVWNLAFMALNAYWVARLVCERCVGRRARPVAWRYYGQRLAAACFTKIANAGEN